MRFVQRLRKFYLKAFFLNLLENWNHTYIHNYVFFFSSFYSCKQFRPLLKSPRHKCFLTHRIRPVLNSPVDHEGERGVNIALVNISLHTVLHPEFCAHRSSPYRHQLKLKEYLSCTHESTMYVENKLYIRQRINELQKVKGKS